MPKKYWLIKLRSIEVGDTLWMGDVDIGSSDLELGTETPGAPQLIGMIFRDVQIPVGATITNAYIQFHVDSDNDDTITNTIFGALEAHIDSSFKAEYFNISSHPKTLDSVALDTPAMVVRSRRGPGSANTGYKFYYHRNYFTGRMGPRK